MHSQCQNVSVFKHLSGEALRPPNFEFTNDGSTHGNFFRHPFHSHLQADNQNVITVSTLGSHRSKWATR